MDIYKVFDLLERIEGEMADLYRKLRDDHQLNKEAAEFFLQMQMEEDAHKRLVGMERRIVRSLPRAFQEPEINLSEINSLLENAQSLKRTRLELPELIGRVYGIESSAAENYLIEAIQKTNDELRDFLMNLGDECSRHREKVAAFASSLGVEIGEIRNRQLRKARVGFAGKVVINGDLGARGVDISESGMFLLVGRTFPDGQALSLQFELSGTPVAAAGEVQYSIEGTGMGVMFTGLAEAERSRIAGYVEQRVQEADLEKAVRVLFVGDQHLPARTMRTYRNGLLNEGYRVIDVSGFEEAAGILRKGLDLSAVVLAVETATDGNYFLLHFISTIDSYRSLPAVVLTGNRDKDFREKVLKQGAVSLVARETDSPRSLIEELKALLEKRTTG